MPTEDEFQNAWDEIQNIVERLGDECEDPTSDTTFQLGMEEEVGQTYAMSCKSPTLDYHIVGSTEAEHFAVVHRFDFSSEISDRLNVQDAIGFIEKSDHNMIFIETEDGHLLANIAEKREHIDIDSDYTELESYEDIPDDFITAIAGNLAIENIDSDLMEELKFRLKDRISSPHTWYSLNAAGTDVFYGFVVGANIFPFESDFGIDDVSNAWTQTTNVAKSGIRYLRYSFNLEREEEEGLINIEFKENRIRRSRR